MGGGSLTFACSWRMWRVRTHAAPLEEENDCPAKLQLDILFAVHGQLWLGGFSFPCASEWMMMTKALALVLGVVLASSTLASGSTVPHVVIVLEENHSYSQVIGSTSMPYLNSLANKYGLATNYYANGHPSIDNYFMLTVGQTITYNDAFTGTVSVSNIVRQLLLAGKTWKVYAEGLPSVGYIGGDTGYYVKHHNPFAYITDVANSSVERLNIVPFTYFQTDLTDNTLPNYSFIVPNILDDAHSGSLSAADTWLKSMATALLSNSEFKAGGVLIVVFDESVTTDTAHGGGHIAMVVAGPNALHTQFTGLVQHQSLLKLTCDLLGLSNCPGKAATAPHITGMIKWP
jgi:phosphatidylinositol-3-phosphatase